MFNPARPDDRLPPQGKSTQDISLHGAQLPGEKSDNNDWHTIDFPGTVAVDQIPGTTTTPNSQLNAMASSSTDLSSSTFDSSPVDTSVPDQPSQREAELLSLVRDLNECNDVLLAKVSQLEESLERSQAALQAEIDCTSGHHIGDREIAQLVTELEQSNQALQHHQVLNESLQTEVTALRERNIQLEAEHKAILRQHTDQAQELLQANTNCRDLRARLQRQQRYTLQFKAALEKCLSMSTESQDLQNGAAVNTAAAASSLTMPKADEIRPWEATLGASRLDLQLESMIRGLQGDARPSAQTAATNTEIEAEAQLWHDLARVMDADEGVLPAEQGQDSQDSIAEVQISQDSPQLADPLAESVALVVEPSPFTEPSPWGSDSSLPEAGLPEADLPDTASLETASVSPQLSPQASEILARVQSAQANVMADTYLPAMSAQGSPSPLVKPLRPQKRIGSLSAIDLPNFPRLKQQPPAPKA